MSISELLTEYGTSLEAVLVAMFGGLFIALGIMLYNKAIPGKIVRYLIANGIDSPEGAVTLEEAGLAKSRLLRYALRDGSMLRKLVFCLPAEVDGVDKKGRTDVKKARFYLPEDKAYRADFSYNNNGTSLLTVLLTVMLFLVMLALLFLLVPWMLEMVGNVVGEIMGGN